MNVKRQLAMESEIKYWERKKKSVDKKIKELKKMLRE